MRIRILCCLLLFLLILGGCSVERVDKNQQAPYADPGEDPDVSDTSETDDTALKTFEGISFADTSVVYDGKAHTPTLVGVPDFAAFTFHDEAKTEVGAYQMSVTVSAEGYQPLTLSATLKIKAASMENLFAFPDLQVDYDGEYHALTLEGVRQKDTTVRFFENGSEIGEGDLYKTDAGIYTFTVSISRPNYCQLDLTATLSIRKPTSEILIYPLGDTVLFQNRNDKGHLYLKEQSDQNGTGKKVIDEKITAVYAVNETTFFFLSKSATSDSLYRCRLNKNREVIGREEIFSAYVEKIVFASAEHLFYSVSIGKDAGIYEVFLDGVAVRSRTKIFSGIADNLCLYTEKSKLYFTNSDNDGVLTSIDVSGSGKRTAVAYLSVKHLESLFIYKEEAFGAVSEMGTVVIDLAANANQTTTRFDSVLGYDFCVKDDVLYYLESADDEACFAEGRSIRAVNLAAQTLTPCSVRDAGTTPISSLTATENGLYYLLLNGNDLAFIPNRDLPVIP